MKGLLIYLAIAVPTLFGGLFYLYLGDGNGEEEWAKMKAQEQVVEEVEEVDYDKEYLKALYDELDDLNEIDDGIEIEEYLKANNIQYTAKDVNDDLDRYIRIERGEWVIEILFHRTSGTACWLTFSSTLYE